MSFIIVSFGKFYKDRALPRRNIELFQADSAISSRMWTKSGDQSEQTTDQMKATRRCLLAGQLLKGS